jgi:uracil-DNA glycosylase
MIPVRSAEGIRLPTWEAIIGRVKECDVCRGYPRVRSAGRATSWNGCEPPDPKRVLNFSKSRALLITEAPPGGANRSFFYCDKEDLLRQNLFEVMRMAGFHVNDLDDFFALNCYLLPSFSYPCRNGSPGGSQGNSHPTREMVEHSATVHLREVIDYLAPNRVVLLGERASWSGRAFPMPCYVTFWPTKRRAEYRKRWESYLVPTLRSVLGSQEHIAAKMR